MPSLKLLRGAAHDLAHHSQSSLSWLHPHLGQVCRQAGVNEASVELLDPKPYPAGLPVLDPLHSALLELRKWFFDLLARIGHDAGGLRSVIVHFQFNDGKDDYNSAVRATISTHAGRRYESGVDFF